MAEIVKKLQEQAILAQEENFIDWDKVLKKFQQSFGNDIYQSWMKDINFKKEVNNGQNIFNC